MLAGSRFCTGAESRYAPVEGEAQGILLALENTKYYTLGNPHLVIATDHKPLIKLFGDRKLGDIPNPRLARLKEGTLRWDFKIIHIPGKLNFGPDTLSRQAGMISSGTGMMDWEMESELVAWADAGVTGLVTWDNSCSA